MKAFPGVLDVAVDVLLDQMGVRPDWEEVRKTVGEAFAR